MSSISYIIPVYNIEQDYINCCLLSIKEQIDEEDEIIVIDDGSKSDIAKFLDTFEDNRCHILHKANGGVSSARNLGLDRCTTEWVTFVDPDDFIVANTLKKMKMYLDPESDILLFEYYLYNWGEDFQSYKFFPTKNFSKEMLFRSLLDDPLIVNDKKSIIGCGVPWAHIYKTSFLQKYNLRFDEKCIRMQDNVFNMYAFQKTESIKLCDFAFYVYRYDHCASYLKKYRPRVTEAFLYIAQLREDFFNKQFVSKTTNELLVRWYLNILKTVVNDIICDENSLSKKERRQKLREVIKIVPINIVFKKNINFSLKNKLFLFLVKKGFYIPLKLYKCITER